MKVRFLLDENLSPRLRMAMLRLEPAIDVLWVGDPDMPHLNKLDPDILEYLQNAQRVLVTLNRKSMPTHLEAHWAKGGIFGDYFGFAPVPVLARLLKHCI